MKYGRLVALLTVVAIIMMAPLSNVLAQKIPPYSQKKITICHFPDDKAIGRVISVSRNAADTHLKMHGDLTSFRIDKSNPKECFRNCKFGQICKPGSKWDSRLCRCVPCKIFDKSCKQPPPDPCKPSDPKCML